jgi:TonB-linked SusC/RagA family outer membrane protein
MQVFQHGKVSIVGTEPKRNPLTAAQILRIVKICTFILLAGCLHAFAIGYGQKITLSAKNASIEKVFREIRKQTGIHFLYSDLVLEKAKLVTIQVKDAVLKEVLDHCFKEQPFEYEIKERTIVVRMKSSVNISGINEDMSTDKKFIDVKGRVVNENNDPVEGVTVTIKGTSIGTTTNQNGEFFLKTVDGNATLVFSHVNIETFELKVKGKQFLDVALRTRIAEMTEVIINKGYYTEQKKLATGNVSTVKAKDIAQQPVQNPLLALVGRVPGVTIEQQTGFANSGVVVRIQGRNSINSGLNPLYVVDGVPFLSQTLPTIGLTRFYLGTSEGDANSGGGNPLSFLNPNDIESIDILKDADATAIYGSRGANGVILITTKKGRAGQTKVNANIRTGWARVNNKVDLLNTEQYLEIRKEAFMNDGLPIPNQTTTPNNSNYDLTYWPQDRYTDWQEVLIGGTGRYTDAQIGFSGGNANTQFLISTGYHKETSVFPGDFADKKGSFQFNINHSSNNQKFKVQTSGVYVVDDNQLPANDLTLLAVSIAPNAPALYNDDGSLNWEPVILPTGTVSTWLNPVADYLLGRYNNRVNNFIGGSLFSYQLLPKLSLSTRLGFTNLQTDEVGIIPLTAIRPEQRTIVNRSATYGNGRSTSWIIEPQLSYKAVIGKGNLEALAGSSFQQTENKNRAVNGSGYTSDLALKNLAAAATVSPGATLYNLYKYNAVFGRLNYNFKDRYIVNFTARRDGSSRFGSENLFNNFWGAAGSWIFSNEKWFSQNLGFVNFGKLRISYGTTGNDQISDYGFMNLYDPVAGVGVAYQGIPSMSPRGHSNPYLQWEETRKLQFGLDLGLVKDKIIINLNYYLNRSSNLLVQTKLSYITGFDRVRENFDGVVENRGWEFSLNSFNIRKPNFTWTTSFNLTIPERNGYLVSFPNLFNTIYADIYTVGRSLYDEKRYQFLGVNPATGLYVFSDNKGNPTSGPVDKDLISFSNTTQRLFGGLQNNITFKGFEVDFTLQFVKRDAPIFAGSSPGQFRGTTNYGNQPTLVLSRWQNAGQETNVQRVSANSAAANNAFFNYLLSDGSITDASFLRLTNLSFSWQLPKQWMKDVHLQNVRLFVQGQNLFSITKYKGLDPGTGSSYTLPPLQVITVGGQITF